MSEPKQSKAIRLSEQQIEGLKTAARKMTLKSKIKVGWTTLVGIAVDEMLTTKSRRKAA